MADKPTNKERLKDLGEKIEAGMPDPMLTLDDLEKCGYRDGDMLPLSKERVMELYERDLTVYAVVDGGSAEMLFDREEFDAQAAGTMYAVSREEWEESPEFDARVQDRLNHQEERERAFLSHEGDCFAIYQVAENAPQRLRFMNMDWLNAHDLSVERGKGIALVDNSREKPRLRYVFDISDTGLRKNSRHPFLWELRPEHEAAVAQALTERFGAPPENNLAEQLESIAAQLVSEYWVEHKRDIYDADLEDLRQGQEKLWEAAEHILSALAALK